MRRDRLRMLGLTGAAVSVGCIAWSGNILLLPMAVAFPAIWSLAHSRFEAAIVSLAYFLAASRGMPQGVATFYASDPWSAMILWLAASVGFVAVHACLWTGRSGRGKAVRYLLACLLMAVPPFGIVGWAHPLTAAGVLFLGWGWIGLASTAAGLAVLTTHFRPAAAIGISGFWLWSAAHCTPPMLLPSWKGVDLQYGAALGRDFSFERHRDLIAIARGHGDGTTIVYPESAFGLWTPTVDRLWRRGLAGSGVTVIAGAAHLDTEGYDNVLIRVTATKSTVIYRERMPVPGSMWQPWRAWFGESGGARAHFFANPVVDMAGTRAAPLICYEQLILWPVLQSMMHDPDLIIAVGNGWWTSGTSIVAIQRASAEAWARLFNKPLILSFNQ